VAEITNMRHLRDFRSPAIFEFFNTIDARQPFIRKLHPVTDQLESGSGRGRLTVPSGEPRHQCFGGICEHRGVRRSCFIPSEPNAAVASVTNVTSLRPFAAASQNIALFRRLGGT
jgi:hypothetical protein